MLSYGEKQKNLCSETKPYLRFSACNLYYIISYIILYILWGKTEERKSETKPYLRFSASNL